jgi:hypothetical protein
MRVHPDLWTEVHQSNQYDHWQEAHLQRIDRSNYDASLGRKEVSATAKDKRDKGPPKGETLFQKFERLAKALVFVPKDKAEAEKRHDTGHQVSCEVDPISWTGGRLN